MCELVNSGLMSFCRWFDCVGSLHLVMTSFKPHLLPLTPFGLLYPLAVKQLRVNFIAAFGTLQRSHPVTSAFTDFHSTRCKWGFILAQLGLIKRVSSWFDMVRSLCLLWPPGPRHDNVRRIIAVRLDRPTCNYLLETQTQTLIRLVTHVSSTPNYLMPL